MRVHQDETHYLDCLTMNGLANHVILYWAVIGSRDVYTGRWFVREEWVIEMVQWKIKQCPRAKTVSTQNLAKDSVQIMGSVTGLVKA